MISESPDVDSYDKHTMTIQDHWLLWQLADSAFPAGSFGHSGGLEAAWQLGEINSSHALESYANASLQQLSRASLPFVLDAHRDPERFAELDELCDVFLSNHVANRGSRLMGKSFVTAAEQSFPCPALTAFRANCGVAHFAPVFGVVTRLLEVEREAAARLFVFIQLRGLFASAVRLGIIGPLQAQRLQFKLNPAAEQTARQSLSLSAADIAHTAPLLDLWQGAHDRLYSRLFQT
jgi:urease accessory protein